ncbi:Tfp pilus assembly protein FimT/FimU [uncultured Fibrobacter sp.]|uniref:pilus assembly FimT family protein n=1 Tax=uncultured Fibrobacter sp. TaxID=261512 RepID=UPI00262EA052|nr:prepilin-type N-terminal cleavage/methylation domain-containing protein [uncultured Fibrobacter sp.]
MLRKNRKKSGYSLSEVLVVVTAMGVLSSMGVVGFQSAVSNARAKDASTNTANFLERVSHEANRTSETLCLMKAPGNNEHKMLVYQSECTPGSLGSAIDSLIIESPNKFVALDSCESVDPTLSALDLDDWWKDGCEFAPRFGQLLATPRKGAVCIKGGSGTYALALKEPTISSIKSLWSVGGEKFKGL